MIPGLRVQEVKPSPKGILYFFLYNKLNSYNIRCGVYILYFDMVCSSF